MQDQIDEIDKAAEVDSPLFWRLINARRKHSKEFSVTIRNEMENIKSDLESSSAVDNFPVLSVEEVESALKLTKRNKAGGRDGLMGT